MATTASKPERRHVTTGVSDIDVSSLKRALAGAVSGEVRFDAGTRAMYANDFSIYRAVPIGVVIPRGPEDVIAGVAVCREHGAPVLPRVCGTAPSGPPPLRCRSIPSGPNGPDQRGARGRRPARR